MAWPRAWRGLEGGVAPKASWPGGRQWLLEPSCQRLAAGWEVKVPFLAAVQACHILTLTAARGHLTQHRRPVASWPCEASCPPLPPGPGSYLGMCGTRTVTKESRRAGPSFWEALLSGKRAPPGGRTRPECVLGSPLAFLVLCGEVSDKADARQLPSTK